VFVLDGGNTFWSQVPVSVQSQGKVMAAAMNLIGYSAMALGGTDLQLGEDVLRQRIADVHFPVLSANVIVQSTGKLLTAPYALLEVGGRKVGVIGLTGSVPSEQAGPQPPSSQPTPEQGGQAQLLPASPTLSGPSSPTQAAGQPEPAQQAIGALAIVDPVTSLASYVKELQTQANIIIVLSNLGWEVNVQLAKTVPGVDLIISAGAGQVTTDPWRVPQTGTLLCQVGVYPQVHPGQLVASVKMRIDSAGVVTRYIGEQAELGPEYADDAEVRELLDGYQAQ